MKIHKFFTKILFFFLFIFLPYSCEKGTADVVPDTYVDITINTNNFFLGTGQSILVSNTQVGVTNLGYDNNGIIVYRNTQDEFFAYDRTCTYHVEESVPVELWTNTMFAICPVCSTKYQLWFSGFPADEGPSNYPLKQYKTFFNPNTSDLHIFNF